MDRAVMKMVEVTQGTLTRTTAAHLQASIVIARAMLLPFLHQNRFLPCIGDPGHPNLLLHRFLIPLFFHPPPRLLKHLHRRNYRLQDRTRLLNFHSCIPALVGWSKLGLHQPPKPNLHPPHL